VELRLVAETVSLLARTRQRLALIALAPLFRAGFYIYELAVVSAAVQIGLVLPMVIYFHRVSLSGLSANLLVVPLMSLIVPAGFLAVFSNWNLPAAAAGVLLDASRSVVDWHVGVEPAWRIPDPPTWLAVGLSAAMITLGAAVRSRAYLRRSALAAVAAGLVLLVWHRFPARVEPGVLELAVIDVGQGESLFVAFPDGRMMLMGGGGFPSYGRKGSRGLDTGEDIVSPYLWSRRIRRLDVVAMSHAHDDHMAGLPSVLANFQPAELWTGATPESPGWQALRGRAERLGVRVRALQGGETFDFGGTRIEVLAPPPGYTPATEPRNNDSLAFRVRYRGHSFLLAGEIEREIEADLLARNALPRSNVLKVAHHGSRTSTTEELLDRVRPSLAVVSAGFLNRYNYPHPEVCRRLAASHATLLGTNNWGLVSIRTDGSRIRADTYRWSHRGIGKEAPFAGQ
jgi:competence protein ComEC